MNRYPACETDECATAEEIVLADLAKGWAPFCEEVDAWLLERGWPIGASGKPMEWISGHGWVES